MSGREAERFEEALQQAAQGQAVGLRLHPLVQTARQATVLSGPVPPPPYQLAPGRQRFLTEAVSLRAGKSKRRKKQVRTAGLLGFGTAMMVLVLVLGLVFGTGQALAGSLPGGPLYGLELGFEGVRLALTTDPQARANLSLALAEERLDEIAALVEQGHAVDIRVADWAGQQLTAALETAARLEDHATAQSLQRLETAIQQRQPAMTEIMAGLPESERLPLRLIVQVMERVRQEAHAGRGDPDGLRQRLRPGMLPNPTAIPDPSCTPHPNASPEKQGPQATDGPEASPGPRPTNTRPWGETREPGESPVTDEPGGGRGPAPWPTCRPGGPQPTMRPEPGPKPTDAPGGPRPTERPGPGPQPTDKPGGPNPTERPGPGPQPTDRPGGPNPTERPGPGPQPTGRPGGPNPTGQPGPPDPQPTDEPGRPDPTEQPGPGPQPTGEGGGGGHGKP